jgi:hypothetical protein
MTQQRKALALISGGLDSLLAARVMQEQGIHVEGVNFFTGFCVEGHTHAIRQKDRHKPKRNNALWVAEQLGIKLHIIDIVEEYKDIVLNPKHGYGANLNPCLDCKIFMVHKALEWILAHGFDFIITGEVVGQRPMSQRKDTMPVVARESEAHDRLVRPLCGKNLPPTLPEREGWIKREGLYDFSGRSRKPQMALAAVRPARLRPALRRLLLPHRRTILAQAGGPLAGARRAPLRDGRHHAAQGGPPPAAAPPLQADHRPRRGGGQFSARVSQGATAASPPSATPAPSPSSTAPRMSRRSNWPPASSPATARAAARNGWSWNIRTGRATAAA